MYDGEYRKKWYERNKEKCREYHRQYYYKHREKKNKQSLMGIRKIKKWLVDILKRKCVRCGLVSSYDCVYDVHHIEGDGWTAQSTKLNFIIEDFRTKQLREWYRTKQIPKNVQLLCANCHRIVTIEDREKLHLSPEARQQHDEEVKLKRELKEEGNK